MANAVQRDRRLLRVGRVLEGATLAWNVIGIVVLAIAAINARSVALAGFARFADRDRREHGRAVGTVRQRRSAAAARATADWRGIRRARDLPRCSVGDRAGGGFHPKRSTVGIVWTALTAAAMFALAYGKNRVGRAKDNPVLSTEARVTVVDGLLACAVLVGLVLNAGLGWWWADPAAGFVIVYYAVREAQVIFGHRH
jgi:divalent metal cation (Fe/Co/Zn/Cd) transporter